MEKKLNKNGSLLKVEALEVIHISVKSGDGSDNDPVRVVEQYWSRSGELLAERDPIID